jgi:hypothetical protein
VIGQFADKPRCHESPLDLVVLFIHRDPPILVSIYCMQKPTSGTGGVVQPG